MNDKKRFLGKQVTFDLRELNTVMLSVSNKNKPLKITKDRMFGLCTEIISDTICTTARVFCVDVNGNDYNFSNIPIRSLLTKKEFLEQEKKLKYLETLK
jgi:hypothetical protein